MRAVFVFVVVAMGVGVGCRAPFAKRPDRVYVPPERNSASSPALLYNRLGGEKGIRAVVDDFVARVMGDSKVNFARAGTGKIWTASAENVARLKEHLVQYLSGATGGPSEYRGKDLLAAHQGMKIHGSEFDAFLEDLKASMEKAGVGKNEQDDVLRIVTATRKMVVEEEK
jgi:hemoglobin